jgi:hypothetical protein
MAAVVARRQRLSVFQEHVMVSHFFENVVDQLLQVVNEGSIVSELGREARLKWPIISKLTAIAAGGRPRIGLPPPSDDNNRIAAAG